MPIPSQRWSSHGTHRRLGREVERETWRRSLEKEMRIQGCLGTYGHNGIWSRWMAIHCIDVLPKRKEDNPISITTDLGVWLRRIPIVWNEISIYAFINVKLADYNPSTRLKWEVNKTMFHAFSWSLKPAAISKHSKFNMLDFDLVFLLFCFILVGFLWVSLFLQPHPHPNQKFIGLSKNRLFFHESQSYSLILVNSLYALRLKSICLRYTVLWT